MPYFREVILQICMFLDYTNLSENYDKKVKILIKNKIPKLKTI